VTLDDILPTGWQAAAYCQLKGGEAVAIWGAGPVGLFAIKSAQVMGAERIIVIETVPKRIALARQAGATDIIDLKTEDVLARIKDITHGFGPDAVIDSVGMEATAGHGMPGLLSAVQEKLTSTQRPYVLEQAIQAVRASGIVSTPGVYGGPVPINMGAVGQKGLTIRSGQTHVLRWLEPLTKLIQNGTIDPTFLITHRSENHSDGPELYKTFRDKLDGCVKWFSTRVRPSTLRGLRGRQERIAVGTLGGALGRLFREPPKIFQEKASQLLPAPCPGFQQNAYMRAAKPSLGSSLDPGWPDRCGSTFSAYFREQPVRTSKLHLLRVSNRSFWTLS
jgi:hypothetical protein